MSPANCLIWIDLEMTGLNVDDDRIIEIATVVTDQQLTVLAEGPVFAIHQTEEQIKKMDDWNTKQHHGSGLVERVKASAIHEAEAEEKTIAFLEKYIPPGKSPMCGNSIWQDRRFLNRYMPRLEQYFHYRMIDVSTVKELALRWAPEIYQGVKKESRHLALDDIHDSINELKYYRTHFFKV